MTQERNPFSTFGRPLEDETDFIGRKIHLSEIRERINAHRPGSIALIGARSIGKTSLVLRALNSEKHALIARRIVPVWISLNPNFPPESFLRDLAEYCYDALVESGLDNTLMGQAVNKLIQTPLPRLTFLELRRFFRVTAQEGLHFLIILDGFDSMATIFRDNIAQFNQLVDLEGSRETKISYIITTIKTVRDVETIVTGSSLLDTRCNKIYVGLYNEADLKGYEFKLLEAGIELEEAKLQQLYSICGAHPYLLSAFGNALVVLAKDDPPPSIERAYDAKAHDINSYFDSLLKRLQDIDIQLGQNNVQILQRISEDQYVKPGEFNDSYVRLWDLAVKTSENTYRLFSDAFQLRLLADHSDPVFLAPLESIIPTVRTSSLQVGDVLDGRYRITKIVQNHPFSLSYVYEAMPLDLPDSPVVIIKEPAFFIRGVEDGQEVYEAALSRFRGEIKILSKYRGSPDLPTLLEVIDERYLVQLICPGESLETLIKRGELLTPQRARKIALAICEIMNHLDEKDCIVHRDLKPAHIFIDEHDQIRIIDFGLAWIDLSPSSRATIGPVMGALYYMAPEQTKPHREPQDKVDQRADIFALGATLYEAITGLRAFPKGMLVQYYEDFKILPPASSNMLPEGTPIIPEKFEAVLMKMMQLDRNARYPDWRELSIALERLSEVEEQ